MGSYSTLYNTGTDPSSYNSYEWNTVPRQGYIINTGSSGYANIQQAMQDYIYSWDLMQKPKLALNKNIRVL